MYKVVIVEDDPMVREINQQYVERHSEMEVIATFQNGKEALDSPILDEADLVILDYYMPIMNGLDFVSELNKLDKKAEVIMVTAANEVPTVLKLFHKGVIDYLVKPFDYNRFKQALDKFISFTSATVSNDTFTQDELDKVIMNAPRETRNTLSKGIQNGTLNLIIEFLKNSGSNNVTSDYIAENTGLSRVTVRRYMNHLIEIGEATSSVDYSTGGRPSIMYSLIFRK